MSQRYLFFVLLQAVFFSSKSVFWPYKGIEKVTNPRKNVVTSIVARGKKTTTIFPPIYIRGGPLHDEMAQGRGGEELATPHSRGHQEQQPRETGGRRGGEKQPY